MQIRGLTKRDFDVIASVLDRWWGGPSRELAHPMFFYELGSEALVAEEDGELIGFLLGFHAEPYPGDGSGEPIAYVHLVGIHPEPRRHGVGKRLYEGSVDFHRALGFTVVEDPDYAGPGRARIVFTKTLAPPN
jgi:GNAT superfamily N-acetyltransferase